jgi:hypothetical protein
MRPSMNAAGEARRKRAVRSFRTPNPARSRRRVREAAVLPKCLASFARPRIAPGSPLLSITHRLHADCLSRTVPDLSAVYASAGQVERRCNGDASAMPGWQEPPGEPKPRLIRLPAPAR